MLLTNCTAFINRSFHPQMYIQTENDLVIRIGHMADGVPDDDTVLDADGMYVVPGFIDQHIHGAYGANFIVDAPEALQDVLKKLPQEGVTSILATTMTVDTPMLEKGLKQLGRLHVEKGAEVLGIHLEGPFISKKALGVHDKRFVQSPSVDIFKKWQSLANNRIKMVTLAPEEDENLELVSYLSSKGIVASIGHSAAHDAQVEQFVQSGCNSVTHCFNAMSGIHHRDIGVAGKSMLIEGLYKELICDLVHVSEDAIQIYDRLVLDSDKILITDAINAKGLGAGQYNFSGILIENDGVCVRSENGNLAGSILTMDTAMKNYMHAAGRSLEDVIPMLTENPAKLNGVYHRKGSIATGKDADLVILDKKLDVKHTLCRGVLCYSTH